MNKPKKIRGKITQTYLRPCKKCDELFKPASKYTYLCDSCKKAVIKSRTTKPKKVAKKKILRPKELGKIKTTVSCPKCGETIDFSHIKQAVKDRLDIEMDSFLEKI